ncbi:MAG TPA: hypothetical protein VK701_03010 [Solirubrobacteraceae bacterium]|jgi:hypothetical protein|nr:hypothetical protein [Solirubrobacteraceae bacterium]
MSVSTEVQRTLVKSPPELWSELSNPEALARHLSELGDVRITAVEPETKVEWEAEGSSGIVHLKQSGWGTKVTLSVTRAAPADEEALSESEAIAEPGPVVETEPVTSASPQPEPEPESEPEPELATPPTAAEPVGEVEPEQETATDPTVEPPGDVALEPDPVVEPKPVATVTEREPVTGSDTRPGFFARLFRRGHTRRRALAEALEEFDAVTEPGPELEIEIVALAAPEPIYPEPAIEPEPEAAEPSSDLAAELASVEAQMTQETTELLTGVLDRLGAAHHRPFSRG